MIPLPFVPSVEMIGTAFVSVGVIFVTAIAAAIVVHVRDHRAGFQKTRFYRLIAPSLMTFGWFELLNNHTQLHPRFVYRSASGVIALLLTAVVIANTTPMTREWLVGQWRARAPRWLRSSKASCPPDPSPDASPAAIPSPMP